MNLVQAQGCAHDYGDGKYERSLRSSLHWRPPLWVRGSLVRSIEAVRNSLHGIVLPRPGAVALIAAAVSAAAGKARYRYTVKAGRSLDGPRVVADAWPPPAMPFRRSLRSPASAAPAFSAINGASPTLLPPWGSPFYLQGGLRSAAQRVRRIARTLSSRRNAGRDHADRAGRSCGVRSVQPVHVPHRKCGRCRSPHPWGRGRCDDRRTFAPSDDRHRMPAPGAFRRRRLSRRACRTADAEARSVRTAAASYRFPQLFFSLRRSSQVCFRRRNLCRRPLFGADVRCARPVRRNGFAPHPFPVRMPGWEGQIRMCRRASSPDRCRPVRPCRAIAERAGAFLVCILCLVLPKTATEKRRNRLRQESFNCYFFHIVKNVCYLCAVETAPSLCGGDGLG